MEHIDFLILEPFAEHILNLSGIHEKEGEDQKQRVLFKLIGLYLYNEEDIESPDVLAQFMIVKTIEMKTFSDFVRNFLVLYVGNMTKIVYTEMMGQYFPDKKTFADDIERSIIILSKKIEIAKSTTLANWFLD